MTFLPIAQRELRVAARQKATYRWRLAFALAAAIIGIGVGLIAFQTRSLLAAQGGVWIFGALKWMAFIGACVAGVFLTSDAISEEKREGTLGVLFLTDLRGVDIATGKLFATSLRPFYGLLAIFPVMAIGFLLGGVPSGEFWRALLAICDTLFFSLALGLAVSALSRDANRAMTMTALGLAAFLFLTQSLDSLLGLGPLLSFASPAFAFMHLAGFRQDDFWISLGIVHALAWVLLAAAIWCAPRLWQQKNVRASARTWIALDRLFGPGRRGKLRNQDPIAWIIARDRWGANLARLTVVVIFVLLLVSAFSARHSVSPLAPVTVTTTASSSGGGTYVVVSSSYRAARSAASILSWALELWIAVQVTRFYLDGKKSGFLELLLCTPTTPADVVKSHWRALRQMFFWPVAAQLALTFVMGILEFAVAPPAAGMSVEVDAAILMMSLLTWFVGLGAIAWTSIWLGLSARSLTTIILRVFCFVKVFPWLGAGFIFGISAFFLMTTLGAGGRGAYWLAAIIPQVIVLLINLGLIAVARSNVPRAFRKFTDAARL